MRQTFTDIPATSWSQRLAQLRQRGSLALAVGSVIVALLVISNVVVLFAGEALLREDAAYRQPPQWPLLQHLLYHPPIAIQPYTEDGLLDGFDTALENPSPDGQAAPSSFTITSTPRFTAVAGQPYRYTVRTNTDETPRYKLLAAPPGMTIAPDGLLTWTPQTSQANGRGHPVEVAVIAPDGQGARQAFTVIASERSHPLGTDEAGHDVGAALLLGTRWTVLPGLIAVTVSLLLGLLFGGLGGYYEDRIDAALSYLARLSETIPALLLLFLAAVIFRYNLYPVMVVLGIVLFPSVARGLRAQVVTLKARQFIEASREMGLSDAEILWKDIIWHNARAFLLTRIFYGFALAVVVEVTLSYLNIGILPPAVSWGTMILAGRDLIGLHHYGPAFFPSIATIVATAGYYLLGSGLEKRYHVKKT